MFLGKTKNNNHHRKSKTRQKSERCLVKKEPGTDISGCTLFPSPDHLVPPQSPSLSFGADRDTLTPI